MNRLELMAIKHPLRVQLLDALADGKSLDLATYAKALDLKLPQVRYHCAALAAAGAVSLEDGTARITDSGVELHRIAQTRERRQTPERRQKPDRRGGGRDRRHG
jgi:DNA-binding transcriptional ArsR family regulator